ncbi:alcohol dehydrogenase catalytic domain-containing protein [Dryocola clanedunensis]|uniref:alcohol dehydrogenase catalytic domain-containing protein n=1 Tax=Cedecea sulfonylureivorans TaxID=3051154 RepID=UPI001F318024|nr:alcohol dehydrogenase catalytic domain-containing protein [Cedecea sulfonylureivorans]
MSDNHVHPDPFQAAVVRRPGGAFELETVRLNTLQQHEVLVRIVATGMCHTDMVARDQLYPVPQPVVLGHEGAGVVVAVGQQVHKVAEGDHVVLTYLSCGTCRPCLEGSPASCEKFNELNFSGQRRDGSHALCGEDGQLLHDRFFGQSSFAAFAVVNHLLPPLRWSISVMW